ncbi:hypothetical protein [Actinocorallia libanotica]
MTTVIVSSPRSPDRAIDSSHTPSMTNTSWAATKRSGPAGMVPTGGSAWPMLGMAAISVTAAASPEVTRTSTGFVGSTVTAYRVPAASTLSAPPPSQRDVTRNNMPATSRQTAAYFIAVPPW